MDWMHWLRVAGRARIKPDEFWSMTPLEVAGFVYAQREDENDRVERDHELEKNRLAWIGAHVLNRLVFLGMKGVKPVQPHDLLKEWKQPQKRQQRQCRRLGRVERGES